jgi:hypothetical protein
VKCVVGWAFEPLAFLDLRVLKTAIAHQSNTGHPVVNGRTNSEKDRSRFDDHHDP